MSLTSSKLRIKMFLLLVHNSQVLLIKPLSRGTANNGYTVVTDYSRENEGIKSGAARVAQEQVGIVISPESVEVVGLMQASDNSQQAHFYLAATTWSVNITDSKSNNFDEVVWFDFDHLPFNIDSTVKCVLDDYQRGIRFNSFEGRSWSTPVK